MKIKGIGNRIRKKLRNQKGDSIAEVLIALLISALALVMLASMITSSANMITNSKDRMNAYYAESPNLAFPPADSTKTAEITMNDQKYPVCFYFPEGDGLSGFQKVVSFRRIPDSH